MSEGESLVELRHALRYFTDRQREVRRFLSYLHDEPAGKILYYHGDGGNGKTLLLRVLRTYCCRRLPPARWEWLRLKENDQVDPVEYMRQHAGEATAVPWALLDFENQPAGEYRAELAALLRLKQQLTEAGLRFPLFDCGVFLYLQKIGRLTEEKLTQAFKGEELALLAVVGDMLLDNKLVALAGAGLDLLLSRTSQPIRSRLREQATLWLRSRGIDSGLLEELRALEAESELYHELVRLFAEDLNAAMLLEEAPVRVILFFDTHERLWEQDRSAPHAQFFARDQWLRRLFLTLKQERGIVVVVAGRDVPRWHAAGENPIPPERIDLIEVGALREADAEAFFAKVCKEGVEGRGEPVSDEIKALRAALDEPLRRAIIAYTSIRPDQVHPLFLALAVDTVRLAVARAEPLTPDTFDDRPELHERQQTLVDRLLKYAGGELEHAVKALAAARSFDYEVFRHLGEKLNFAHTEPQFKMLTGFSFVYRPEAGVEGSYRIHELLRRLFRDREQERPMVARADEALEEFYRGRAAAGEQWAIVEAIYHANRLDAQRGYSEWAETFEQALQLSQHALCEALLNLRSEMVLTHNFARARMSQAEGDYGITLSGYEQARQAYDQARAFYDQVLLEAPDDAASHNNRGYVLAKLGDVHAELSQHQDSLASYQEAIRAYDAALQRAPDDKYAHTNKGNVLQSIGALQAGLSQHDAAFSSYKQAIAAHDEALRQAPNDITAHNNKGNALVKLGDLQAGLSRNQDALTCYEQAIAAYGEALRWAPDYVYAHNNKGNALQSKGDLQAGLSQHDAAFSSYKQAIDAYDEALRWAPDNVYAHNNRGLVLQSRGILELVLARRMAEQGDESGAEELARRGCEDLRAAVAEYSRSLDNAPGDAFIVMLRALLVLRVAELCGPTGEGDTSAADDASGEH